MSMIKSLFAKFGPQPVPGSVQGEAEATAHGNSPWQQPMATAHGDDGEKCQDPPEKLLHRLYLMLYLIIFI